MVSAKLTRKQVQQGNNYVFIIDEDFRHYLNVEDYKIGYNAGQFGWNWSCYQVGYDVAMITGYRNMPGEHLDFEIQKKYVDKAKAIYEEYRSNYYSDYDTYRNNIRQLLLECIEEVKNR